LTKVKARGAVLGHRFCIMSEPLAPTPRRRPRRHPWRRLRVRLRRAWRGVVETVSFFAAAGGAVGSFLLGRWPEASRIDERTRRRSGPRKSDARAKPARP